MAARSALKVRALQGYEEDRAVATVGIIHLQCCVASAELDSHDQQMMLNEPQLTRRTKVIDKELTASQQRKPDREPTGK